MVERPTSDEITTIGLAGVVEILQILDEKLEINHGIPSYKSWSDVLVFK